MLNRLLSRLKIDRRQSEKQIDPLKAITFLPWEEKHKSDWREQFEKADTHQRRAMGKKCALKLMSWKKC